MNFNFPRDADYRSLNRFTKIVLLGFLMLGMLVSNAFAQSQPSQIFNNALATFQGAMSGVEGQMLGVAKGIFLSLFAVEVAWSGVKYVLDRDNPASLLKDLTALLVQRSLIGVIVWNGPQMMRWITGSFTQLGQQANGGVTATTASGIVDKGLQTMSTLWGQTSALDMFTSPLVSFVILVCGLVILLSFAVAGLQMMMTQIEFYIVASGAVFMLGFFGSKVTKQFGEKYISFCIGAGIKMFTIYLVLGAATPLIDQIVGMAGQSPKMEQLGTILAASIVLGFLCWSIPGLAASIAAGTVNTNAAGLAGVAGSLAVGGIGAAGMSAAAGRSMGSSLAGLGQGAAGGKALWDASRAGGMSRMAAAGEVGKATIGAGLSAAGGKAVGGADAVANTVGGRVGAAMSGQAQQMAAAQGAAPAPAPSSASAAPNGAASAAPSPADPGASAGQGSTTADAGASQTQGANSTPASSVERGEASSAAPRMPAPSAPQSGGMGQHLSNMAGAATPPPEASASVGAGFTMNSEH